MTRTDDGTNPVKKIKTQYYFLKVMTGYNLSKRRIPVMEMESNTKGLLSETITANQAGIILGHNDYAVAYPGSDVMAFGVYE